MVTLNNGRWSARISETGAELKSLRALSSGQEYIWNGDPAWWTGSAPVLFPIVGSLKDGQCSWEGRTYALPQHGFARRSQFAVARADGEAADLALTSSAATREIYPFDFVLTVSFRLEEGGVGVRYDVKNGGIGRMLFSIGSHPAFAVPFAGGVLEDYRVAFEKEEVLPRWFVSNGAVVPGKTEEVMENGRMIRLSRNSFDRDAMIFKNPRSRVFAIENRLNPRSIRVITDGVPYLGVWAKPGGAPFLCVEPWHGIADAADATGHLEEKEGILALEPGAGFTTGYRVQIT